MSLFFLFDARKEVVLRVNFQSDKICSETNERDDLKLRDSLYTLQVSELINLYAIIFVCVCAGGGGAVSP